MYLVSDTFELSRFIDKTIYVLRQNHTDKILEFIEELHANNKLNNISLVLNSVGSNKKYSYLYNYKYGYKYGYNYGYGYGYGYDIGKNNLIQIFLFYLINITNYFQCSPNQ